MKLQPLSTAIIPEFILHIPTFVSVLLFESTESCGSQRNISYIIYLSCTLHVAQFLNDARCDGTPGAPGTSKWLDRVN